MKMLLSTTAIVVALGFPALTLAETTTSADGAATQQGGEMAGFLVERGETDLFASELMGQDVYARRDHGDMQDSDGQVSMDGDGSRDMPMMDRADLDEMETIGQINEIVLSNDGQVRGFVIGVGGFLGMGAHDVAVTMEQITFASDADDRSRTHVIVNTGADMFENAPPFERARDRAAADGHDESERPAARADATDDQDDRMAQGDDGQRADDRTAFAAPDMARDGYDRVEAAEVSTEMLMGQAVYDVNDDSVGTVADMIVNDSSEITHVVIDFGGFLGMGSSQVSLAFEELTILSTEGFAEVRIYIDATKEQIQELPQYVASN